MSSLPNASAPVKSQEILDAAGQREILIHALRAAVARSRLTTNLLENVGVALRHRQISNEGAMAWLRDEGLLDYVQFPVVSS